jgi:hypothetical protein
MNKFLLCGVFCLALTACYRVSDKIEPKVNYQVQDRYLRRLPSPFPPLTEEEKQQDWGKEYQIGIGFARQLDLYQAITAFKRADFLLPQSAVQRRQEVQYEILLCYFVGKKYDEVIYTFENSDLQNVTPSFPAYQDLLVILEESFREKKEDTKADNVHRLLQQQNPEVAEKISLSNSLRSGDLATLQKNNQHSVQSALFAYEKEKKSVGKAQALNAILPGSGYLYLGQQKSAITAFLLNGLFIAAAVHSFQHRHFAAGIIFSSFEAGWYFGGIYGGGEEAKYYNERLYERKVSPMMNHEGLFPVFMLQYGF